MGLFTGMQVVAFIGQWSLKALSDGKVTGAEAVELVEGICQLLRVRLEWDVIRAREG